MFAPTKKKHAVFALALAVATAFDAFASGLSASAVVGLCVNFLWLSEV